MKWRSIETAPKDGTFILLAGKSGYITTPLRVQVGRWSDDKTDWLDHGSNRFTDGGEEATLWHPLEPDADSLPRELTHPTIHYEWYLWRASVLTGVGNEKAFIEKLGVTREQFDALGMWVWSRSREAAALSIVPIAEKDDRCPQCGGEVKNDGPFMRSCRHGHSWRWTHGIRITIGSEGGAS